jgi:hypothetical protein
MHRNQLPNYSYAVELDLLPLTFQYFSYNNTTIFLYVKHTEFSSGLDIRSTQVPFYKLGGFSRNIASVLSSVVLFHEWI